MSILPTARYWDFFFFKKKKENGSSLPAQSPMCLFAMING